EDEAGNKEAGGRGQEPGLESWYEIRAATRKVHIDTAAANSLQQTVRAEGDFSYFPWTRERGEDHWTIAGDLRRRCCRPSSSLHEWPGCLRHDVVDHHGVASLPNILAKATADSTQTNKAYHLHFSTSSKGEKSSRIVTFTDAEASCSLP